MNRLHTPPEAYPSSDNRPSRSRKLLLTAGAVAAVATGLACSSEPEAEPQGIGETMIVTQGSMLQIGPTAPTLPAGQQPRNIRFEWCPLDDTKPSPDAATLAKGCSWVIANTFSVAQHMQGVTSPESKVFTPGEMITTSGEFAVTVDSKIQE